MSDTTANHSELLPSESLDNSMQRGLNLAGLVLLQLADADTVGPGEGNVAEITWGDSFAIPSGTKAENAEAELVSTSDSSTTVTAGTLAFTFRVSRELRTRAKMVDRAQRNVQDGAALAMREVEADGFALTSSLANSNNQAGNNLTDDLFRNTLFLFRAQEPDLGGAMPAFVCGYVQLNNWFDDLDTNGGTWAGADAASGGIVALAAGGQGGVFVGNRYGCDVLATQNTLRDNVNGDRHCVFMARGPTSPFVYRNWNPLEVEEEYFPRRRAWEHTVSIEYGWALARDNEGYELIVDDT